jgi:eukaryotic-like serine/threonine-protein kinase
MESSQADDVANDPDACPRSSQRPQMPTSYRLIMEPRKGKPQSAGEPRNVSEKLGETPGAPGGDMAITIPNMRAVTLKSITPAATRAVHDPDPATPAPVPAAFGVYTPGDVLVDRYRLIEPVGLGGMGAVWRAHSIPLDLDVAVKLLRRDCVIPDARERMLREVRLAARVAHPAAVRVFDSATTATGDPFLVMELLRGRSLSKTLAERGPIGAIAAVQMVLPLIEALAAAHAQGIVHRDVKPSNILLLDGHPTPKLIDFGIACAAQIGPTRRLTAMDLAIGSPDYMAPEQLRRGAAPDLRSDVWGVCATLYESVSGVRLSASMAGDSPFPSSKPGKRAPSGAFEQHPRFWAIIARGVASAPEARWPTMIALGSALAEWALSAGATCDVSRKSLVAYCVPSSTTAPDLTAMAARLELAALYRAQKRDAEAEALMTELQREFAAAAGPGPPHSGGWPSR